MKSAHRHELETNALAERLDVYIERMRPYAATVAGVVVALVVIMFIWSYVSGSSAARQGAAWDAYHRGVASVPPNLDQLRRSAEEYPGTKMQQLADVTWADGQVWMAARDYFTNREAAMEALRRAASTYQRILQTSDDERLLGRSQLGLARIYEMQNELDKAREEYLKVRGGYAEFAKLQAERLAKPEAREAYAWLATAVAPRPTVPAGPGTPGQRPEFSTGDFPLPGDTSTTGETEPSGRNESIEEMLKGFDLGFPQTGEDGRYKTEEAPPAKDDAKSTSGNEKSDVEKAEAENDLPATEDKPSE